MARVGRVAPGRQQPGLVHLQAALLHQDAHQGVGHRLAGRKAQQRGVGPDAGGIAFAHQPAMLQHHHRAGAVAVGRLWQGTRQRRLQACAGAGHRLGAERVGRHRGRCGRRWRLGRIVDQHLAAVAVGEAGDALEAAGQRHPHFTPLRVGLGRQCPDHGSLAGQRTDAGVEGVRQRQAADEHLVTQHMAGEAGGGVGGAPQRRVAAAGAGHRQGQQGSGRQQPAGVAGVGVRGHRAGSRVASAPMLAAAGPPVWPISVGRWPISGEIRPNPVPGAAAAAPGPAGRRRGRPSA